MHVIETESGKRIILDLEIPNQDDLYHPNKSNFNAARMASVRLHRSLHKKNQFESFQSEIEKGINEKQLRWGWANPIMIWPQHLGIWPRLSLRLWKIDLTISAAWAGVLRPILVVRKPDRQAFYSLHFIRVECLFDSPRSWTSHLNIPVAHRIPVIVRE